MSSITKSQIDTLIRAVNTDGRVWEVCVEDNYDGYRIILLAPGIGNTAQASFFVTGTATHLDLYQAKQDDLVKIGTFSDIAVLLARLLIVAGE